MEGRSSLTRRRTESIGRRMESNKEDFLSYIGFRRNLRLKDVKTRPGTRAMTYRAPRPGECRHETQDTAGSNQYQLRIRCTRCNCHLAIVWIPYLNANSRRLLIEMITAENGVARREQGIPAPHVPREEARERRRRSSTTSTTAPSSSEEPPRRPESRREQPPQRTQRAAAPENDSSHCTQSIFAPPPRPSAEREPDAEPQPQMREIRYRVFGETLVERFYSPERGSEERL